MLDGNTYTDKRVAVVAAFDSEGGCTNWRGWTQALNDLKCEWKHWDSKEIEDVHLITEQVIDFNPDVVLILLPVFLNAQIDLLKEKLPQVKVICIYPDYWPDGCLMPKGKGIPFVDYLYINSIDQIPLFEELFTGAKVSYLPMGCYQEREQSLVSREYEEKIVFVGKLEGFTGPQEELYSQRVRFWNVIRGEYKYRLVNINEPLFPGRNKIYDQLPEIYKSADYCLNLDAHHLGMNGFTSNRIFAILNFGGLLVTHPFQGMEELGLSDMNNCVIFKNIEELKDKITLLDKHSCLRKHIKMHGRYLGRTRHTNTIRLKSIFGDINL